MGPQDATERVAHTIMVRIKERYLLVNIIYPPDTSKTVNPRLPTRVALHRPTTEDLTFKTLQKALKKEIALLFGDYGAGALGTSESSICLWPHRLSSYNALWRTTKCS